MKESWSGSAVCSDSYSIEVEELKRERSQLVLTIAAPGLVGAEMFELCLDEGGEMMGSFLIGSGSSVVSLSEELQYYDALFYVSRDEVHDVVSVNATVTEYNRFIEHDFM